MRTRIKRISGIAAAERYCDWVENNGGRLLEVVKLGHGRFQIEYQMPESAPASNPGGGWMLALAGVLMVVFLVLFVLFVCGVAG